MLKVQKITTPKLNSGNKTCTYFGKQFMVVKVKDISQYSVLNWSNKAENGKRTERNTTTNEIFSIASPLFTFLERFFSINACETRNKIFSG